MPHDQAQDPNDKRAQLRAAALEYHEFPTPGKISVTPTKQLVNQHDLALAVRMHEVVRDHPVKFKIYLKLLVNHA